MRCPVCQDETPLDLPRCVHCNSPLDPGAKSAPRQWSPPDDDPLGIGGQSTVREPWQPGDRPTVREPWRSGDQPTISDPWWGEAQPTVREPSPFQEPPVAPPTLHEGSPGASPAQSPGAAPAQSPGASPAQDLDAFPTQNLDAFPAPLPDQLPSWDPGATAHPPTTPWEPQPESRTEAMPRLPGQMAWGPEAPTEQHWQPAPSPPVAETWRPPVADQPKRSRSGFLLIGAWVIVVVAALTALGIVFWPSSKHGSPTAYSHTSHPAQPPDSAPAGTGPTTGPTPTPTPSAATGAQAEASAIDQLLDSMTSSRSEFGTAMDDAQQCANLSTDLTTLQKVVGERQTELSTAQNLNVDALPSGSALKTNLVNALQASLDADNAYVSWAQANQGCTGSTPDTSDFDNGNSISTTRATPAKQQFLTLWTPIAQQYSLNPRDAGKI
jgi:hypothetical protein